MSQKMNDKQRKMAEDYLPTVSKYIKRRYLVWDEYYDILTIALCEATLRYDEEIGVCFATFLYSMVYPHAVIRHNTMLNAEKRLSNKDNLYLEFEAEVDDDVVSLHDILASDCNTEEEAINHVEGSFAEGGLYSCCKDDLDVDIVKRVGEGDTYDAIGKSHGITRQCVQQRFRRIVERYKKYI